MGFHINENVEHLQTLQGFSRKGLIWVTFNAIHCRLSESLIMFTESGSMVKSYIQTWQHYKSSLKTKLWDFCWNRDPQAHIWPFWMNQEWLGGHTEWMSTRAFCPTKMQTQYWPYSIHMQTCLEGLKIRSRRGHWNVYSVLTVKECVTINVFVS